MHKNLPRNTPGNQSFPIFLFLLLCSLIFSTTRSHALTIAPIRINQWVGLQTSSTPLQLDRISPRLKRFAWGNPYVGLYRVSLQPGEKYSLELRYQVELADRKNIPYTLLQLCIYGANPLGADSTVVNSPVNTTYLVCNNVARYPPGTQVRIVDSFTVSSKSLHSTAFLVLRSKFPVNLQVRIHHPALPDDDLKKSCLQTTSPGGKTRYFAGCSPHHTPLWLGYGPDEPHRLAWEKNGKEQPAPESGKATVQVITTDNGRTGTEDGKLEPSLPISTGEFFFVEQRGAEILNKRRILP